MATFYNPYGMQPTYPTYQTQPYQPASMAPAQQVEPMKWVEGEVGAKAFQMPMGWPADKPYPLWDNADKVIYLKSWNAMGMPNPITRLKYEIEEIPPQLPAGQSTSPAPANYATKDDLEQLKTEIMSAMRSNGKNNQNGSNPGNQNRGGNA